MARRRFRSLASRMAAVAVLQLLLLAATAVVIFFIERPDAQVHPDEVIDVRKLEALAETSDGVAAQLADLRGRGVAVSIYNSERRLLATNVDPALAIPARHGPPGHGHAPHADGAIDEGPAPGARHPGEPRPPGDDRDPHGDEHAGSGPHGPPPHGDRGLVMPFHVAGDHGVLIARSIHTKPPGWIGPVITLVCGLLILVLGAVVTARWIVRPIDQLSKAARALGTGDLAARGRLERNDEIGELGYRFDEMADRLETLMRSEKELFANVAHELRTPLARIGVALDLAGEGDAEAARASLAEIAVDVAELETIVDDILTAMRFEISAGNGAAAQLPMHLAHVSPRSIVDAAAERARARNPSRSVQLDVANDLPLVDADPMLLRRVIDNLLENAHKYTPDAAAPTILAARRDATGVVFEVRDRGIGIAVDDLPRVFTPFFRGDRSRSRETGGVGLGLSLAKRIVEAHHGRIEVISVPAGGTTMRVEIPAAR